MSDPTLAQQIASVSRLEGSFVLRSGATATEYFDKYRFESAPDLLERIADAMVALIPATAELLAGLELGGVPIATALSLRTRLPVVFVRKRAKEYGTARLAEGAEVAGRRVCIVEDVVTSGGQVVESCAALRLLGALIEDAVCVIDRQAGGVEALAAAGVRLRALYRRQDLDRFGGAG